MALTRATDKIIGDSNGNLNLSGIVTATRFSGPLVPSGDLNVGNNIKLGTASGIITATTFSGNISGATGTFTGNLGVGGVLTYEDVTNIDSIGIITARSTVSIADSIVHTGDTNTSLRFPAADTITAETAGVERFRIFSDGKFGFGTDSLSEQTMAEFTSSVGGGAIGANITIRNSSTNSVNNVAELRLKTAHGVARFFKYNTGETYLSSHVGGASDLVLEANGAKSFRVNTNTNERFRVDLAGRFLVGTTAYKSNLNASSDVQIGQFVGKNDNECACLSVFSYAGTTNPTARGAKLQLHRARSTDGTTNTAVAQNDLIGSIEFKGNDGTSFTAAARIDVNIDDAPGTDDMPGRMVFSTSANGSGAPTERFRIASDGKGFFNTTSAVSGNTAAFQVRGGISIDDGTHFRNIYQSGSGHVYFANGTNQAYLSTSGSWTNASDIAYKKDIEDITYGIDTVKQLKPRKYKHKGNNNNDIGFIAQELETNIPEVVSGDDGSKGVSYGNLTAVLTKALQEAIAKIETLEAKVAALEDK